MSVVQIHKCYTKVTCYSLLSKQFFFLHVVFHPSWELFTHIHGYITINSEGIQIYLQIMSLFMWPLSSRLSLACHTSSLLWHRQFDFKFMHLWRPMTFTPIAERLAVYLITASFNNLGVSQLGLEHPVFHMRGKCSKQLLNHHKEWTIQYSLSCNVLMKKDFSILYNIFVIGQVTSREYSGPCENTIILYIWNRICQILSSTCSWREVQSQLPGLKTSRTHSIHLGSLTCEILISTFVTTWTFAYHICQENCLVVMNWVTVLFVLASQKFQTGATSYVGFPDQVIPQNGSYGSLIV